MKYAFFFGLLTCLSCTNTSVQQELKIVKQELATAQEKINNLEAQIEPEGELVHLVLFKVKSDADQTVLVLSLIHI